MLNASILDSLLIDDVGECDEIPGGGEQQALAYAEQ